MKLHFRPKATRLLLRHSSLVKPPRMATFQPSSPKSVFLPNYVRYRTERLMTGGISLRLKFKSITQALRRWASCDWRDVIDILVIRTLKY